MIFSHASGSVTLKGALFPEHQPKFHMQTKGFAADGTAIVYDHATDIHYIDVTIRDTRAVFGSLRTFIESTVSWSKETFSATPDSTVDWGSGLGSVVTVKFWESNDIYDPAQVAPGVFEASLRMVKV